MPYYIDPVITEEPDVVAYRYNFVATAGSSFVYENSSIRDDMVVANIVIGDEDAQGSDWEIVTGLGNVTINGTINNATDVSLILVYAPIGDYGTPEANPKYGVVSVAEYSRKCTQADGMHMRIVFNVSDTYDGITVKFDNLNSLYNSYKNSETIYLTASFAPTSGDSYSVRVLYNVSGYAYIDNKNETSGTYTVDIYDPVCIEGTDFQGTIYNRAVGSVVDGDPNNAPSH